jgi:hypothetical protein
VRLLVMTRDQRQLVTLGLALVAGVGLVAAWRRFGPSGGHAEVDGRHQAALWPGGFYRRCEEWKREGDVRTFVRVVDDSKCRGCGGFNVKGCP